MLKVDKEYADKYRKDERVYARKRYAALPEHMDRENPEHHIQKLNCRIPKGYMRLAAPAFSTEHNIGNYRDIIIPAELILTARAMRIRLCKAHIIRKAVYNHVEKASYAKTDYCRKNVCADQNKIFHKHLITI